MMHEVSLEFPMAPPQQIWAILDVFEYFKLTAYDFIQLLSLTDTYKEHLVTTKSLSFQIELCLEVFTLADTTSKPEPESAS